MSDKQTSQEAQRLIGQLLSPALHLADTVAAGDGLCDEVIAQRITQAARMWG